MTDIQSQAVVIARIMEKWGFEAPAIGEDWPSTYEKIIKFLVWADGELEKGKPE